MTIHSASHREHNFLTLPIPINESCMRNKSLSIVKIVQNKIYNELTKSTVLNTELDGTQGKQ